MVLLDIMQIMRWPHPHLKRHGPNEGLAACRARHGFKQTTSKLQTMSRLQPSLIMASHESHGAFSYSLLVASSNHGLV